MILLSLFHSSSIFTWLDSCFEFHQRQKFLRSNFLCSLCQAFCSWTLKFWLYHQLWILPLLFRRFASKTNKKHNVFLKIHSFYWSAAPSMIIHSAVLGKHQDIELKSKGDICKAFLSSFGSIFLQLPIFCSFSALYIFTPNWSKTDWTFLLKNPDLNNVLNPFRNTFSCFITKRNYPTIFWKRVDIWFSSFVPFRKL